MGEPFDSAIGTAFFDVSIGTKTARQALQSLIHDLAQSLIHDLARLVQTHIMTRRR